MTDKASQEKVVTDEEYARYNYPTVVELADGAQALAPTETPRVSQVRKPLPLEWQRELDRKHASNGLAFQPYVCENCGHHLFDNAVLLGVVRKKCPVCKFPNAHEFNRVGEEQLLDYMARKAEIEARQREQSA